MSYDKYTWTTGETITADKLNHIENGIAEGGSSDVFIVNWIYNPEAEESLPDKTFEEILQAWSSGKRIKFNIDDKELVDAFPGSTGTDVDTGKKIMNDIHAIWFGPFTSSDSNTWLYCYTIDDMDHTTMISKSVQFGS